MEYIKRLNNFVLDEDIYPQKELEERRKRVRKSMFAADMRIREEYERTHRYGTCPNCHFVIPASGKCDCGYDAITGRME